MPQRSIKQPPQDVKAPRDASHYFDSAHGDVAALHARIEQGFKNNGYMELPSSLTGTWIEAGVERLSRSVGILGLVSALIAIAYCLM